MCRRGAVHLRDGDLEQAHACWGEMLLAGLRNRGCALLSPHFAGIHDDPAPLDGRAARRTRHPPARQWSCPQEAVEDTRRHERVRAHSTSTVSVKGRPVSARFTLV